MIARRSAFDLVQRTLAINVSAGEKSIQSEVKAKRPPRKVDAEAEVIVLANADGRIARHFRFSWADLAALTADASAVDRV